MLNLAPKTKNRYMILYDRIVEFGMFKTWDDVNADNLYEFDAWLHQRQSQDGRGMISDAGVYNYHKCFKALLNRAMRIGVIEANPYNRLRGEFKRGDQESFEYLTEDEMKAFEALRPVPGTVAAKARDLFVFQMYTGLSYSDAQAFNIRNYKLVDGRWRYNGKRIKTGVPYISELLPPVIDVLERNGWKVPKIENGSYNKILKVLGMAAGIQTRFHSHLARHTFATWVLSKHVDIQNVAKMLGQKDIKTTQRYAKVLAESVHDDFERLGREFDVSDTNVESPSDSTL
jgi:integrase